MDEIFNLDAMKSILNESEKARIEAAFNEAVEVKAAEIASEQVQLKELELREEQEEEIQKIKEESEKAVRDAQEKIAEKLDSFLQEQMDKFANVVAERLDPVVEMEKTKAVAAVFDKVFEVAGVELGRLTESGRIQESNRSRHLQESYDSLKSEVYELRKQNAMLMVEQEINDKTKSMTLVESEKFKAAAKLLPIDGNFSNALDRLYESFKNSNTSTVSETRRDVELPKFSKSSSLNENYKQNTSNLVF